MKEVIKLIEDVIPELKDGERFLLGIDGLSRAGKTNITKQLEQFLQERDIPYVVFHIDDFIETRKKRYHTGYEQWEEYYYLQWDVESLRKNLFEPCKSASFLKLPYYDSEKDQQLLKKSYLPLTGIILVEGVFLQREIWRDYFDYVVYIEASRETRFSREASTIKNQREKFEKRYWKAEEYYLETVGPVQKANLLIQN